MICARCRELEQAAAHWRRRAHGVDSDAEAAFIEYFGVEPAPARLLGLLHAAGGKVVGPLAMMAKVNVRGGKESCLKVHLSHLRQGMEPEAVETVKGEGYRLSPVGLEECATAIADSLTVQAVKP